MAMNAKGIFRAIFVSFNVHEQRPLSVCNDFFRLPDRQVKFLRQPLKRDPVNQLAAQDHPISFSMLPDDPFVDCGLCSCSPPIIVRQKITAYASDRV